MREERKNCERRMTTAAGAEGPFARNELFILAEETVQLASRESCAYTEFAADSNCSSESCSVIRLGLARRRGHVFDGNPARHKLSPQQAAFIYGPASRWLIFGGAFLVQQRRAGECGEIQ